MKNTVIRSRLNPKLEVSLISGHFATRHSHNSHYIDITRMKHEHTMAREAAMTLAQRYAYEKGVDTIVCLDGSEVIGTFLARHLAKNTLFAVNGSKNINIVTPEYDSSGLMIFRDNLIPMVAGKNILILISTINSARADAGSLSVWNTTAERYRASRRFLAPWRNWTDGPFTACLFPLYVYLLPPTRRRSARCVRRGKRSTLW